MVLAFALLCLSAGAAEPTGDPERGALLAGLAGCASCHTAEGGPAYGGGYELHTPFGSFFGPNLSPDPDHGIGDWAWSDFVDAMRRGRSPEGQHYYPAFPYPSYTKMSETDLADLWAFLQTIEPVTRSDEAHRLSRFQQRGVLTWYKLLELDKGPLQPRDDLDAELNRGRYLVQAVGHCGECHTPRNRHGGLKQRQALAGSDQEPEPGPNITPHEDGLAGWTVEDWLDFLELGMTPEVEFVGGEMARLIERGTAPLPEEDRRAIARWMVEGVEPVADP